ncbi:TPA: hypothetical protein PJH99_002835 [Raoultella ornithinolytica]|nr:hypothetical protein [Raoultella ornithinolytica]HDG9796929.1 hypothetical protein [Raoultella ornithinolytica]HDG9802768.1 hypothetical protein [Raoultella ornithinolytica]HDG9837919.1 hypothetical protein [Raoultella ornithinolytica]HDH7812577.1 hypothetical protein [Raoultella ornithinolytica]
MKKQDDLDIFKDARIVAYVFKDFVKQRIDVAIKTLKKIRGKIWGVVGLCCSCFFFALISSVVSCCFVAAKESANVSIQNSKKYDIALIKKQHRRRGGG